MVNPDEVIGEEKQEETAEPEGGGDDEASGEDDAPDPLEEALRESEEYKDRWIRLAAEFDNYKKRRTREFDALIQSASENLIRDLLPVLDSVARALEHRADGDEESDGFKQGVTMIMEELPKVLQRRGLSEIEAEGQPFDPNYHEALMQMTSEDHAEGLVMAVVERGYRLGEKVIRPSRVVVSGGSAGEESGSEEEGEKESEARQS
ncbi:MAG: nucleotide exchange factor GrpE [Gemmatimonadota bacterium]|nr:nucleotide exchange factor GrpE [Gemmatimonadota bacterium]